MPRIPFHNPRLPFTRKQIANFLNHIPIISLNPGERLQKFTGKIRRKFFAFYLNFLEAGVAQIFGRNLAALLLDRS
jgi:hypothetical protein